MELGLSFRMIFVDLCNQATERIQDAMEHKLMEIESRFEAAGTIISSLEQNK